MNSSASRSCGRISSRSTAAIARAARSGSAAPESTAQDCAIESIRHSSLAAEPERRAVVEPAAAIPVAVPGLALERTLAARSACARHAAARAVSPRASASGAKSLERRVQEPAEPDALALAAVRRRGSCRRSSRRCRSAAARARRPRGWHRGRARSARTACRRRPRPSAGRSCRARRRCSSWPSRNGTTSSSTAASPVALDIVRDGVGEPHAVVGDARAHALAGMRQPPMLHVALDELPGRGAQQMRARQCRLRGGKRHAVLQLVAEAVGAARLVERRARPDAAGQRLIQQPAVQHDVHRPVRRLHLHRAERIVPVTARPRQARRRDRLCAIARDQRSRLRGARRLAEEEHDLDDCRSAAASIAVCSAAQGSRPAPTVSGQWRCAAGKRRWDCQRAVAAEEFAPVAGPVGLAPGKIERTRRAPNAGFHGLRASIAPVAGVDLGRYERRRRAARRAEHPFDIGGHRQAPRRGRRGCAASAARS